MATTEGSHDGAPLSGGRREMGWRAYREREKAPSTVKETGQCDGKWEEEEVALGWVDGQGLCEVTMLQQRPD